MATNIPPHNLREVADAVQWLLTNHEATKPELLEACMKFIKGPDFPSGATIVGTDGIEDAYRTGRGSITQRAVVSTEEIGVLAWRFRVVEPPYQVNPDNLACKIAEMVKLGKIQGIADITDETSGRTGQRLVITPQARRRGEGGAEQPLQAHPAAGVLLREHARPLRRRAPHLSIDSSCASGRSTRSTSSCAARSS